MKKVFFTLLALSLFAGIAYSGIFKGYIDTSISASGYTAINVPSGVSEMSTLSVWTEDTASYYMSETGNDSDAILVPANFPISIAWEKPKKFGSGTITLFYIKGTSTTNLVGVVD